VIYKLIRIL